ncbi:MAG: hypothetical protein Q4C47_04530, partial [Planctomycetia bacterium]|nr:hypothetical protein [Planctomycetia bacterium]
LLSAIFACSEDESAYAGYLVDEERGVYLNPLAFAYVLLLTNTPEDLVEQQGQVHFPEFCDYAKTIVAEHLGRVQEGDPEPVTQTPVVLDGAGKVFLRPPHQEESS